MPTLIYFVRELPGLSHELERHVQVYEALAVSEVHHLCEQHPNAMVVIDHTVEAEAANQVAQNHIPLRLTRMHEPKISWEISGLSPESRVQ